MGCCGTSTQLLRATRKKPTAENITSPSSSCSSSAKVQAAAVRLWRTRNFKKKMRKKNSPSSRPPLRTASPTPCKYRSRCYPVKEPCERWKSAPGRNTQRVFSCWDGFFHSPGPATVVRRVLGLEAALAAKGLAINFNKCELYDPAGGAQPLFDNSPS